MQIPCPCGQLFLFATVGAEILLNHLLWHLAVVADIIVNKIQLQYHVAVVYRGATVAFLGKVIIVVLGLHDLNQLVCSMVELAR